MRLKRHRSAVICCISGVEQLFDVQPERERDNFGLYAMLWVRWLEFFMVARGRNRCWPSARATYAQQQ